MSQPERLVVMTAEQVAELVTDAVRAALQGRPAADDYIDKHTASTVGLSASGFVALCRSERFTAAELRGRKYVAKRSDVLAYLAASQKPKAASQKPKAAPIASTPADPIEAALANGRLALVRGT